MDLTHDILLADATEFGSILADAANRSQLRTIENIGVSIDDVVTLVALHRDVVNDRSTWWKLRREAYEQFSSHEKIKSRTLARLPDAICSELADLNEEQIRPLAAAWVGQGSTTPASTEEALASLERLVAACAEARKSSLAVFLRSFESTNAFEVAFKALGKRERKRYQAAFESWNAATRHDAHERYKGCVGEGYSDCLEEILKAYSRRKTSKLDLKSSYRKVVRHIKQRVKAYAKTENNGPGKPQDPITLITLASSFDQAGWVALVFDTRPGAGPDGEWNQHIEENAVDFDAWCDAYTRLEEHATPITITCHDGTKRAANADTGAEVLGECLGNMLRDALVEVRDSGGFARLPLAEGCVMFVDEHDGHYGWPDIDKLTDEGRVN